MPINLSKYLTHDVLVGGNTRQQLRTLLSENHIQINDSAERLLADERFPTSPLTRMIRCIELDLADLGLVDGATSDRLLATAQAAGLQACPLELAVYLRLQYRDQAEGFWGQAVLEQQAPSGSLTVISEPISADPEFPKGFYLRKIKGELWLRGYRAWPEHVWQAHNRLLFMHAA
jgi:hypothetical protein